uniref:Methyltransferase-like protein 22 n=1 Tax=Romanomermis culicivorax TaxID=13658 RepID=A0A915IZ06_ROMCU
MTPQLFINYKMKSVAHLPWRMLTYKFLNTFIDDIFAFVIKMPTMYRIGCFRDDIIFLIYLYQRWIYRVDPKRMNEFGVSGEELENSLAISAGEIDHGEVSEQAENSSIVHLRIELGSVDLFMSDVHIGERAKSLNRKIDRTNYEAYESSFVVKILADRKIPNSAPYKFDEDGDLIMDRDLTFLLRFEHALLTTLSDVGLQLWNGGVLMCEFILSHKSIFENKVIFEFGVGVGLSSVCLGVVRTRKIFATDLNIGSLRLAERNYALNSDNSVVSTSAAVNFLLYDWSVDFTDLKNMNTLTSITFSELFVHEAKSSDIFLAADESLPSDDWNVIQWDLKDIPDLISKNLEFGRNENM